LVSTCAVPLGGGEAYCVWHTVRGDLRLARHTLAVRVLRVTRNRDHASDSVARMKKAAAEEASSQ
jgi:hypothetical protein